jgi:uncharacterized damage-inducible protein DinB
LKQILWQYAAYNFWANTKLMDVIVKLSDEQLHTEINSSYKTIFLTVLHLWDAESIWWQRIKLAENPSWPGTNFVGTITDLNKNLLQQSLLWKEWVHNATEATLGHEFIYLNSKKEQFKQPVSDILQHMFNHQSFHRGQLITMLRQVGITKLPSTDLIVFTRKK